MRRVTVIGHGYGSAVQVKFDGGGGHDDKRSTIRVLFLFGRLGDDFKWNWGPSGTLFRIFVAAFCTSTSWKPRTDLLQCNA